MKRNAKALGELPNLHSSVRFRPAPLYSRSNLCLPVGGFFAPCRKRMEDSKTRHRSYEIDNRAWCGGSSTSAQMFTRRKDLSARRREWCNIVHL